MTNRIFLGGIAKHPFTIINDRNLIFTGQNNIYNEVNRTIRNKYNIMGNVNNRYLFFTPIKNEYHKYNFLTVFNKTESIHCCDNFSFSKINNYSPNNEDYNQFTYDDIYKLFQRNDLTIKSIHSCETYNPLKKEIEYCIVKTNQDTFEYSATKLLETYKDRLENIQKKPIELPLLPQM